MTDKRGRTNDDDRVRDHLANERTYLAWLRTGMATMGFGVVIARLRYLFEGERALQTPDLAHASRIGIFFAIIGLFMVMTSGWRYAVVQNRIRHRDYKASKHLIILLSLIVIVLGFLIVGYLLLDARHE